VAHGGSKRSEAHLTTWLAGRPAGATIPVAKLAELAIASWSDRLAPDWQPHDKSAQPRVELAELWRRAIHRNALQGAGSGVCSMVTSIRTTS
jgi:hypothetical protein